MPSRKRKVPFQGELVEATVMPFQVGGEHWNEYLVDDGTVVRMKLVATEIFRIDGQYDQMGNPLYVITTTNVTNVSAPDELRQGGS
jgi:hypothetical protein